MVYIFQKRYYCFKNEDNKVKIAQKSDMIYCSKMTLLKIEYE